MEDKINDNINHPAHYTDGKIEVIDYIEDKGFDFCLGNAIKYISRAGKKNPDKKIEDLEKAIWYLRREIKQLNDASHAKAILNMMYGKDSADNDTR